MNRREFLLQTGLATAGYLAAGRSLAGSPTGEKNEAAGPPRAVALVGDANDPVFSSAPATKACERLRLTLRARGFSVQSCRYLEEAAPGAFCVSISGTALAGRAGSPGTLPPEPEAFSLTPARLAGGRGRLIVSGGDARGLAYALTELTDAVALASDPESALRPGQTVVARPANPVRSVMRLFASDVEDKAWFNDRDFWRRYLALLAEQRFNRFQLALGLGYDAPNQLRDTYFYFAYPFLLQVPGYSVSATGLDPAERDRNLEMLRFMSDEAAACGLDFQLGVWTHAYQWVDSPHANYRIDGLTPETQAPYSRDALAAILRACPGITGVTFRIHGESGVPEGSYDLWRTIFDGCVRSGRRVGIDMHAKGMDQPTLDVALGTGLPVTVSPKFSAEHMGLPYHQAAIRELELPKRTRGEGAFAQSSGARSFLRYSYGDLLREDRRYGLVHRIWPGTQRLLLWGDPVFAAAYSRAATFCGSQGCEIFDPLSFKGRKGSGLLQGRSGYRDSGLAPGEGDFEKYRYTYRLWGRLLYQPDTPPSAWQLVLRQPYGDAAGAVETALAHASRILPLMTSAHLPSAANNNYWPEMYVNMPLAEAADSEPYSDTPKPKRFGTVSPLDPQLFSGVDDHAAAMWDGTPTAKYSPLEVAQWLEDLAEAARAGLSRARELTDPAAAAFRRLALDVEIQIGLGFVFAHKLRASVLYALSTRSGAPQLLAAAIARYERARAAWAKLATAATGPYLTDITYGPGAFQRGHWADRLPAIDRDIASLKERAANPAALTARPEAPPGRIEDLLRAVAERPVRPDLQLAHLPPASFRQGEAVTLSVLASGSAEASAIRIFYRRTNQAEGWRVANLERNVRRFQITLPIAYTNSPYPLAYYFETQGASAALGLFPGLGPKLSAQPYFVVRPSLPG